MKPHRLLRLVSTASLALLLGAPFARPQPTSAEYAWKFPVVSGGQPGTDELREELQFQAQRILDAGPLAPLYLSFGDRFSDSYTVYNEPLRVVTTLAWAYPHLTATQRTAVRAYVAAELADLRRTPWAWADTNTGVKIWDNYRIPTTSGAAREDHPKAQWWWLKTDFGNQRPTMLGFYGLWLYGYRTGDWAAVSPNWSRIWSSYNERQGVNGQTDFYGAMSVHVAVARLAAKFGTTTQRDTALSRLQARLTAGTDFNAIDQLTGASRGTSTPYGYCYQPEQIIFNGTAYRGWPMLNLSPEIGRYLADFVPGALTRHNEGKEIYPQWWVSKPNYYIRYFMGEEGTGLTPEYFGMFAPMERWVAGASPATLRGYMKSAPYGRGDCYWIEGLVLAIEAHGNTTWRDVTLPAPPSVQLTAPKSGAVPSGALTLTADAFDPDGTVSKVEFVVDGSIVGTDTTAPYWFNWANPPSGSHTVLARATDASALVTDSLPAAIDVPLTGYTAWALQIPDAAKRGATQDNDSDGLTNGAEYVLGLSPFVRESPTPTAVVQDVAGLGSCLTIAFGYNEGSAAEFDCVVQSSGDLTNWTTVWTWNGTTPPATEVSRTAGTIHQLVVRDTTPATAASRGFLRLSIQPKP